MNARCSCFCGRNSRPSTPPCARSWPGRRWQSERTVSPIFSCLGCCGEIPWQVRLDVPARRPDRRIDVATGSVSSPGFCARGPMHPAYSVILFTTASGAGLGLLTWLALLALVGAVPVQRYLGFVGLASAFVLVTSGLLSSTMHLGRPERAWRAFSQ